MHKVEGSCCQIFIYKKLCHTCKKEKLFSEMVTRRGFPTSICLYCTRIARKKRDSTESSSSKLRKRARQRLFGRQYTSKKLWDLTPEGKEKYIQLVLSGYRYF